MIQRRHLMGALAASPWWGALPVSAQTYPDRPIKIIVPLPPGSPPDVLARTQSTLATTFSPRAINADFLIITLLSMAAIIASPWRRPNSWSNAFLEPK